ncbi:MAG: phosphoribosylaminoimidazolesuccinocarboxamide synthase [Acidimicrobiia bacterium]|nr:phosphoribosylaminoimidazolesuccinocarboxamide synthase [Acidimicrobiia bacterium]
MPALEHLASGKVREIYVVDDEHLLVVASDRISAYDAVLPDPIPDKGRVLTGLSIHWFGLLDTPHHLVSTDVDEFADDRRDAAHLAGRSMVVRRAEVLPMECVVRGYLYGSAWREYDAGGGPSTEHLPAGLRMADRLPAPVFTPATKAEDGHDENLTETDARELIGDDLYEEARRRSLAIYETAAGHAADRGILLADTKFEFGLVDGELTLVDEVLTPDSSRYWPADAWAPGAPVPSYDKQFVRDALDAMGWDHDPPAPHLDPAVVAETRAKYVEAFERLTGDSFSSYLKEAGAR